MSGRLIAFWSPCSGSGVTTLVAHTSRALAKDRPSDSVAAVDLNLAEPSLGVLADAMALEVGGPQGFDAVLALLRGRRLTPETVADHLTEPPGVPGASILAGPASPLLATTVHEPDIHLLLDSLVSRYHFVLADLAPTLDAVGTWPVLERAHEVVWVCGAHYPGRYHTRRHLAIREALGLTPGRCCLVFNLTRPLSAGQMEDELGVPPDVVIPHTPSLQKQEERGGIRPAGHHFSQAVASLVARIGSGQSKIRDGGRKAGAQR